jgi:hypothetical protein
MQNPWLKSMMDMTLLGLETQAIIAQGAAMIALGKPGTQAETQRLIMAKLYAAADAAMSTAGASDEALIRIYRRKIQAHARRPAAH